MNGNNLFAENVESAPRKTLDGKQRRQALPSCCLSSHQIRKSTVVPCHKSVNNAHFYGFLFHPAPCCFDKNVNVLFLVLNSLHDLSLGNTKGLLIEIYIHESKKYRDFGGL